MEKIIITIDGHSACGKSTLAKQLAEKLQYGYVDTGAMYRAVTYYFLENRVNVQKTREVSIGLEKINIHFKSTVGGNRTFLNGADVEDTIRKMFVSKSVSHVAAMSAVRKKVVKQQQELGRQKGIVMEGRDIGTVVFPKAELKIFLTANEDVRTERRFQELKANGQNVSANSIRKNLKERDHLDSTREDSPLKQAKEAILIDNSNLTQKEQLAMVLALANERIAAINRAKAKSTVKKPIATKPKTTATKNKPKATPVRRNQSTSKTTPVRNRPTSNAKPTSGRNQPAPKAKPVRRNQPTSKPTPARNQSTPEAKPVRNRPTSKATPVRSQSTSKAKTTSGKNQSTPKTKPNTAKPTQRKAAPTNQKKSNPPTKTKPSPQKKRATLQKPKAVQKKSNGQPTANTSKPKVKAKPAARKTTSKPQRPNNKPAKSNNTKRQVQEKKHHTPKPKQNSKKKDSIEDLLDDFSF